MYEHGTGMNMVSYICVGPPPGQSDREKEIEGWVRWQRRTYIWMSGAISDGLLIHSWMHIVPNHCHLRGE